MGRMAEGQPHRGAVLGLAVGGVLLGHWLAYALVIPSEQERAAVLDATGHGYLHLADTVGWAVALVAFACVTLGPLLGTSRPLTGWSLAVRLVTFQTVAFLAMEILERLASGAPVLGVVHGGLIVAGLAVQALVALGVAALVRWLRRTVERAVVVSRATFALPRPALAVPLPAAPALAGRPALPAPTWRAPPAGLRSA
jgi:hypothetical protein